MSLQNNKFYFDQLSDYNIVNKITYAIFERNTMIISILKSIDIRREVFYLRNHFKDQSLLHIVD